MEAKNKIIAGIAQMLYPGYGTCYRCGLPWSIVKEHTTRYTELKGIFPLCGKCWRDLNTPENRMPYYRQLYNSWGGESPDHKWGDIENAVMKGL